MSKSVFYIILLGGILGAGGYFLHSHHKKMVLMSGNNVQQPKTTEEKKAHETVMKIAKKSLEHAIEIHNTIADDLAEAFSNIDIFGSLEDQEKELIAQRFAAVDTQQAKKLLSLFSYGGFFFGSEALSKVMLITLVCNNLNLDQDTIDLLNNLTIEGAKIQFKVDIFKDIMDSSGKRQERIKKFLTQHNKLSKKDKPDMEKTIEYIKKLSANPHFSDPLYPQLFLPE